MQVPQLLNNLNSSNILESVTSSNYILPFAGLFLVRFFLFRFISGSLGLLLILAAVFLIFSSDPSLSSQLSSHVSGLNSFGDVGYTTNSGQSNLIFGQNPYLLAGVLFLIIFLFRPRRFSLSYIMIFALIGYLLFFRDFRPATLIAEGSWKTSLTAAGLLLIVLFFIRRRNRYFYNGAFNSAGMNLSWFQPLLLFSAMAFATLVIKNPAWLEAQLPGWKSSIGFGVIAASCVGFFYNLPIRFRPYALSACWLFVVITVSRAMGFLAF